MKTSKLTGKTLAYAVGVAEGCKVEYWHTKSVAIRFHEAVPRAVPWNPHTDWSQGGPIIESEKIQVGWWHNEWQAQNWQGKGSHTQCGPTPLIAAMRCFVASKLGDEIEIPEELK